MSVTRGFLERSSAAWHAGQMSQMVAESPFRVRPASDRHPLLVRDSVPVPIEPMGSTPDDLDGPIDVHAIDVRRAREDAARVFGSQFETLARGRSAFVRGHAPRPKHWTGLLACLVSGVSIPRRRSVVSKHFALTLDRVPVNDGGHRSLQGQGGRTARRDRGDGDQERGYILGAGATKGS